MAKVTFTGKTARKLSNPKYIVVTEFLASDTEEANGDSYILEDVLRDTTSLPQDDNERTDIERETSDTPIKSIVKLGKRNVSATVNDWQDDVAKALAGYVLVGNRLVAPSSYKDKYVKFATVFNDDDADSTTGLIAAVYPKVMLDSKSIIESLNSQLAGIEIGGVAQDVDIAPAFSAESTYEIGDAVIKDNKVYVCKTAVSSAGSWSESSWDIVENAPLKTPFYWESNYSLPTE